LSLHASSATLGWLAQETTLDQLPADQTLVERWRLQVLDRVFLHMFLLIGFIWLVLVAESLITGQSRPIGPLGLATALQALAAFVKSWSTRWRAGAFVAAACVGLGTSLPALGLRMPNPFVVAGTTLVIVALCVGRRFALAALAVIAGVILVAGVWVAFGARGPTSLAPGPANFAVWLHVIVVFVVTSYLVIHAVDFLVRKTADAMAHNGLLFDGLKAESKARIQALEEKQALEENARRSHELQLLGLLAANVAHDFNNLLVVILGNADLLKESVSEADRADLLQIESAGQRAADLCRRLLTLGRESVVEYQPLELGSVVEGELSLLRTMATAKVNLTFECARPVWMLGARSEVRQILLNLCANARDAMPNGGSIAIVIDQVERLRPGASASSPHVRLTVRDQGIGMNAETRERLFEPFFTTKSRSGGTGLGMPIVKAAVEQQGGCLELESEPGRGTTFSLYFPVVDPGATAPQRRHEEERLEGTETVLLVDDDEGVRRVLERYLTRHGYQVLVAKNGQEGLRMFGAHRSTIGLVVSDAIMPHLGGAAMCEEIMRHAPELPFLFCSGFAAATLSLGDRGPQHRRILAKPFNERTFLQHVRSLLDERAARAGV